MSLKKSPFQYFINDGLIKIDEKAFITSSALSSLLFGGTPLPPDDLR